MRTCQLFLLTAALFSVSKGQVDEAPGQLFEERNEDGDGVTYYKSGGKFSWDKSLNLCKVVFGEESTLLNVNTPEKLSRIYELLSRENGEVIPKRFWTDGVYDPTSLTEWRWNGSNEEFGEFIEWEENSQLKDENSRALIIINEESGTSIKFAYANKDIQYPYVCDTPKSLACS